MSTDPNTGRDQPDPRLVGGWLPDEQIPPHLRDLVARLRRIHPNSFPADRPDDEFEDDWRSDDPNDDLWL